MGHTINPANRVIGVRCPICGTNERYRNNNKCCECTKLRKREERVSLQWCEQFSSVARQVKPKEPIPVHDPTKGGVFADSIRHLLRAGHA